MKNITTIIPISEITPEELPLLENALNSIKNQSDGVFPSKVIIIHKPNVESVLFQLSNLVYNDLDVKFIVNQGSATIQNQLNTAIAEVDTEYFAYLEFDDQFTNFYFKHVDEYIKSFNDVSVFLPFTADVLGNGTFVRYGNAECFTREVSEQQGFITHDALLKVPMFNSISGGVFKVEDFVDLGKLKENVKYTFIYEYFLRITNQDQKIMVIPKLGYIHILDRKNSYTVTLNNSGISQEELAFWFEKAKQEFYFHKIDRKIEYTPKAIA